MILKYFLLFMTLKKIKESFLSFVRKDNTIGDPNNYRNRDL